MNRAEQLREILNEQKGDWIETAVSLIEPQPIDPAELCEGDTVLVELTYAEEQEYNGSMFYNENTGRLIAIDQPKVYKP